MVIRHATALSCRKGSQGYSKYMSKLIPEVRVNKNGVPVTKHVLPNAAQAATKSLPAPLVAPVEGNVRNVLPALKGKVLKEAKEIVRMSPNGDQLYEDLIMGAYLGNDIRYMRILSTFLDNGGRTHPDTKLASQIMETRMRLGLGDDETTDEFVEKCNKYVWMTDDAGPVIGEDFDPQSSSEESDKIIQWIEANWEDLDEISAFFQERSMDSYTAEAFSTLWNDYKGFAAKPLRDGYI